MTELAPAITLSEMPSVTSRFGLITDHAIHEYEQASRGLFSFLAGLDGDVSSRTFRVYRDNYLYRTKTTFVSLTRVATALAQASTFDTEAFRLVQKTIDEEAGSGAGALAHRDMLAFAHNIHGSKIFGLSPVHLEQIEGSSDILPEAVRYREVQRALYSSENAAIVLGAFAAQEGVANEMLDSFHRAFFEPFRGRYPSPDDYDEVAQYFSSHLDGTEAEHARRAVVCAERTLVPSEDEPAFTQGAISFLDAQSGLWKSLHGALAALQ